MAIATQTASAILSIEEYLNTTYRPDCDFVDGHLEERNLGMPKRAELQMHIGHWFLIRRREWKIRVMGDVRTRVSATRVRLPDVGVFDEADRAEEKAMNTPPRIAIEILSREDRIPRVVRRLDDFASMGVAHIWLIDPVERISYIYDGSLQLAAGGRLSIPNSPIYLDLPELFASLD